MDMDDEELEPCAFGGGVVFSPLAVAGGSAFIGLWESSEIPPFPFTSATGGAGGGGGGAAGGLALELCGLCAPAALCSVDFGEGVAVDMAEIGEDAAELCACGVDGVTAGWMLFTRCCEFVVEFSESLPSAAVSEEEEDESLGLSALLRLPASPPLLALSEESRT